MTLAHPAYAQVREVTPIVSVMLENNPGMMTLDGTNTWILRAPGRDECVVVDPGDADEEHLARVAALGPVALTLITHRHFDHTGGVQRFFELTGAPVRSVDPEFLRGGGDTLVDGETIDVAGLTLTVIATPGHTKDSVSFTVEGEGTVLTGDTILGRGTTVLDDTDGDLGDYLSSLRRLLDLGAGHRVMPGHGPELPELNVVAQQYLDHREVVDVGVDVLDHLANGGCAPERLVDGLTGSADELGDLFLREVVRDAERARLLGAEPLRELQQRLGDTTGDVREDEVGQVVVGTTQTAREHPQELFGDLGAVVDPRLERFAVHADRADLGDRGRGGRTRTRVEDGQLTEHVGRAHDRQQVLTAVRRAATDLHLARNDDVQAVTGLTFVEDDMSAGEVDRLQLLGQRRYR